VTGRHIITYHDRANRVFGQLLIATRRVLGGFKVKANGERDIPEHKMSLRDKER
jgi:hypothetical protein